MVFNPSTDTNRDDMTPRSVAQRNIAEGQKENVREQLVKQRELAVQKQENKLQKQPKDTKSAYPFLNPEELLARKKKQEKIKQEISKYQAKRGQGKILGILPRRDQVKLVKIRSMLVQQRLQNEIEKLRIQNKIKNMRLQGKGILLQPAQLVRAQPKPIYPAYSTPETNMEIDQAFNADINPSANDMWGAESYYGGENYYDENYFGSEFDNADPLAQLAIKIRRGVSPLLW